MRESILFIKKYVIKVLIPRLIFCRDKSTSPQIIKGYLEFICVLRKPFSIGDEYTNYHNSSIILSTIDLMEEKSRLY